MFADDMCQKIIKINGCVSKLLPVKLGTFFDTQCSLEQQAKLCYSKFVKLVISKVKVRIRIRIRIRVSYFV